MNLFIDDLAAYLKQEWDSTLNAPSGPKEARFIVQSLDPEGTLALFETLDAHRKDWAQRLNLVCHLRVARGLWDDWRRGGAAQSTLQTLADRDWVDQEDRLTWYRNRTVQDEQSDALVVVLVGLNHATDQGGLADFHRVDEHRLLSRLNGGFEPWLQRISEQLGLHPAEIELSRFDAALRQLFALRPLRLAKLSAFLQPLVAQGNCYSLAEFRERVFKALPFWDIPPLLPDENGSPPDGQQAVKALKAADAFFSHQTFKTKAGQQKAWRKLEPMLEAPGFVPPAAADGTVEFGDVDDYRDCVKSFIEQADPGARERLLRVDFMPVVGALGAPPKPTDPKPSKETVRSFSGLAFTALLRGVWDALADFQKSHCKDAPLWQRLDGIQIKLEAFHHDLSGDDTEVVGVKAQGRRLLRGCLGGLERLFAEMDLRLPSDDAQLHRPPSGWGRQVAIGLDLALDSMNLAAVRGGARPFVQFRVSIADRDASIAVVNPYRWYLDAIQPERVRQACAKEVLRLWKGQAHPHRLLPAFRIGQVDLTALYFAADVDEANRLLSQSLGGLALLDLSDGLASDDLAPSLRDAGKRLSQAYREWLKHCLPGDDAESDTGGYYAALLDRLPALLQAYDDTARLVLDGNLLGASELLRRLYKAFLLVDDRAAPNDAYLSAAIAWGLSPAVLELSLAQARFLADGFPEAVGELAMAGKPRGQAAFDRLLDLSRIQRPMTALVTDPAGHLSTRSRSFGLVHCLGAVPETAKSLAVQTMLREDADTDGENVRELIQPCEEQPVVRQVLELYSKLHPHARDGLRILALHVQELPAILAGVDGFLKQALKVDATDAGTAPPPPFYCTVMVYSTSSSPLAMENGLARWREDIEESHRETGRPLVLTVGHRFAPKQRMAELLRRERRLYDVAFLFHFLRQAMDGRVEPAAPFTIDADGLGGYFPIAEYPRPIRSGDRERRQMLLSNRRLRVQTRHSDLSARLSKGGHQNADFVVYGQVDFAPWLEVIGELHPHAEWVACVDSFVDKWLLAGSARAASAGPARRKIVGFESGLGAYGELNLTISTEQDSLEELVSRLRGELTGLLPHQQPLGLDTVAERIVADAEEIIGLASLRAVLGKGEQLREVIGFAAIRRLWQPPAGEMSQLLPLDALRHWFADAETNQRADLLALTLKVRPDDLPLVHAAVLECKLAGQNPVHKAEALAQVCATLRHLTRLLAPRNADGGLGFDRRYWWGQLHRAIASRVRVHLPDLALRALDQALEQLAEGRFEVCWHGLVFTFWTNVPMPVPTLTPLPASDPVTSPPMASVAGFTVQQVELGYLGLAALFAEAEPTASIGPQGPAICLRPVFKGADGSRLPTGDVDPITAVTPVAEPHDADQGTGAAADTPVAEAQTATTSAPPTGSEDRAVTDPLLTARASDGTQAPPIEPETAAATATPSAIDAANPTEELEPSLEPGTGPKAEPAPAGPESAPAEPLFSVPERLLIGTRTGGEPVYWHFGDERLANRHLLVFGTSGSGKTYGIQCLLAEMAGAGLRSLIIDYTNGFLPGQMQPRFQRVASPKSHFVRTERLPLNPFRRQRQVLDPSLPEIEEGSYEVATRIESIFASVFDLGDQQSAAMIRSLQSGLDLDPAFSLDGLLPRLREDSPQGETLANKLEPLIQAQPFREGVESAWEGMLTAPEHRVHVLQLAGLAREIQKLVTEFVLWDLWDYAQSTGSEQRPIPIVLDEIQNLDHSSDSPIDKMLREGRKFGVALMLATQTTSNFNPSQRDRLFQAGHKLFFKPATTETDRFAQILSQATPNVSKPAWGQRLAKLEKGQCWSLGPVLRPDGSFREEAVLVSVTALEQRGFEG